MFNFKVIQHKTLTAHGFKLHEKDNRGHHRVVKPQEQRRMSLVSLRPRKTVKEDKEEVDLC